MKHIKYFESYSSENIKTEEFLDKCWKSANIGDIRNESDIYQYVQQLHHTNSDFYDGDLGDRIEEYPSYKLKEILISKINIDEWDFDSDMVDNYISKYKNEDNYPPIVLDKIYHGEYTIIDGTHRVNALNDIGIKTINAWVGL